MNTVHPIVNQALPQRTNIMHPMDGRKIIVIIIIALILAVAAAGWAAPVESGFTSLFDGKTLNGWTLVGQKGLGYAAKDGAIVCLKGGGGNLFTEKEYADFILRLEFKLDEGSNNGVGIRAPLSGDTAYM